MTSEPTCHNYWSPAPRACAPQQEKPPCTTTRESPHSREDSAQPQIKLFILKTHQEILLLHKEKDKWIKLFVQRRAKDVCVCALTSDSLWPTRLLCPWDSQARILEWVAISFPRASSWPLPDVGIEPTSLASPALAGGLFTTAPPGNFACYK